MKNKVIATSWHPGGANAIIPVIKRLQNDIEVEVIGHGFSEGVFKRAGIDYKTIGDYHINNISTNSMIQIIQKIHPQLVLTGSSIQDKDNRNVIEQTITLAARKKKIKSLSVMDWWGNLWEKFSDLYDENGRFREEIYGKLLPPGYTKKDGKFKFLPDKKDIENLERIVKEEEFNDLSVIIVDKDYNTRTAIMASDVAVAASSTTLIESTYLDLPSISLQPGLNAEDYLEATNKLGITIPIYKKGEIGGVLRKLIFDEGYRLKLATKRKEFQTDGKATERVTNLV